MGQKKEWLKSEIDELINLYHNKPELWDVKSKGYKDRVKKRDALGEMAQKFETTIEEITRKIHNLRNQFNSELKKTSKKKSGQSTDELYTSKWPYFKSLLFLQSGLICRSPIGNITTDDVAAENESENDTQCDNEDVLQEPVEVNTVGNVKPIYKETPQNSSKKKRNNESQESDLIMQKAVHVLNEQEDQYDVFGTYVATELRNLSSEYLRKKLKKKFQQAILEISEEEERLSAVITTYSNPGSVESYSDHTAGTSAYSNLGSVSSYSGRTAVRSAYDNPGSVGSYSGHADSSNHTVQVSQQPLIQTVADYLHSETESTYANM